MLARKSTIHLYSESLESASTAGSIRMNRNNATVTYSELPNLLQLPHPVQAAEHISHLATDTGCAFDCLRHVLGELSTVLTPLICQAVLSHLYSDFCRACRVSNLANCCTFLTCYTACRWSPMLLSQRHCRDCKARLYRCVNGTNTFSRKHMFHQ